MKGFLEGGNTNSGNSRRGMSAAGDRTSEREVFVSEAVSAESEGGEKRTAQGEKRRRKPLPLDCFSVENEGYQWRNSLFSKAETEMAEGSIRAARCLFRFGGVGINTATGDPLLREIRGSLTGSGLFFPASSPRTLRGGGAKEEAAAEGDAEGDGEKAGKSCGKGFTRGGERCRILPRCPGAAGRRLGALDREVRKH